MESDLLMNKKPYSEVDFWVALFVVVPMVVYGIVVVLGILNGGRL